MCKVVKYLLFHSSYNALCGCSSVSLMALLINMSHLASVIFTLLVLLMIVHVESNCGRRCCRPRCCPRPFPIRRLPIVPPFFKSINLIYTPNGGGVFPTIPNIPVPNFPTIPNFPVPNFPAPGIPGNPGFPQVPNFPGFPGG